MLNKLRPAFYICSGLISIFRIYWYWTIIYNLIWDETPSGMFDHLKKSVLRNNNDLHGVSDSKQ